MARTLILVAAGFVLILLVYTGVARRQTTERNLETLSSVAPEDPWFQETVLRSEKPVLVDFTATWCGYCKQMKVVLDDIEQAYGDRLEVIPVDVDEHPNVAAAYGVEGIPALMVVTQGKVVAYAPGLMRYENIEDLVRPYLGEEKEPATNQPAANDESTSRPAAVTRTTADAQ